MKKNGFSLLELSIVLVIIGLIAGGIVAGAAMIRAAELRAVMTEFNHYQIATNTFRDKYLGIPGDLRNANAFWTDAANGNGNGEIEQLLNIAANADTDSETFGFWEQLALAELISGTFDGQSGPNQGEDSDIGHNVPTSKLSGAGWAARRDGPTTISDVVLFEGIESNNFRFGAETGSQTLVGAVLSPEEMWNIDKKIDDGKPGRGILVAREASTDCHTAGTSNSLPLRDIAEYNLSLSDIVCSPIFIMK